MAQVLPPTGKFYVAIDKHRNVNYDVQKCVCFMWDDFVEIQSRAKLFGIIDTFLLVAYM